MSDNVPLQKDHEKTLHRAAIIEIMVKNMDRLPDTDKKMFEYGPLYLGGNGAFAGLIANSLFRRSLNVTQGFLSSSVPLAVLPFLTTAALYTALVSTPLLSGELNCPSCVLIRSGLVGVLGAGLYPILLALPVNAGLASRYSTAPMPEKGNTLRFFVELTRPVLRKMRAVLVLQAFFGGYLGSRHFETYAKLVRITMANEKELTE